MAHEGGGATATAKQEGTHSADKPNWAVAPDAKKEAGAVGLEDQLEKLEVR